jgi:hypothetical protein
MKTLIKVLLLNLILTQTAFAISTVTDLSEALKLQNSKVNIIERQEWGADENIRFYKENIENPPVIEISEEKREKFKDELKISKKITKQSGKTLVWPLEYAEKITKFIIHHTATDTKKGESMQDVKDIYRSHAIGRGWGDIGYNYLIDEAGKIYEGRYGGEGVVGGHSGIANIGSIGIAVLGTYGNTKVPKKVVNALVQLIAEKAKLHNVTPEAYSDFRGEVSQNVIGHRDVGATECPGDKLETLLPIIAKLATRLTTTTTVSELSRFKSYKGYNYEDKSGLVYIEMDPSSEQEFTIKLQNTDSEEWGEGTFLVANNNPEFENVVSFPEKKGAILAPMQQESVKKGQLATFKIKLKTELKSDLVYLNLAPVIDGKKKLPKYVILPLLVNNADYTYEIVDSKFPKIFMKAGEKFEGYLDIKNLGNVTWKGSGENRVVIGTDNEKNRVSEFADPAGTRMGYLIEDEVKPGETGRFLLRLKAPDKKGYYKEYFTPVMEGITWFENEGNFFESNVYERKYDSRLKDSSPEKNIKAGEVRTMWIKLANVGGKIWKKDKFSAKILTAGGTKVSNVKLQEEKVAPGEVGTVTFQVEAPENTGRVVIYIYPRINSNNIYFKSVKFPVNIVKSTGILKNKNGQDIRVKLSFEEGKAVITGDGKFNVYENGIKMKTYSAGDEVEVDSDQIYRFVPEGKTILEIKNFENRPAWNPSLNDNKYRGVLEVRENDGELIVINELLLEDYLKGLAENQNTEPYEKMKALVVLARSYALYYMKEDEKFPGKPYNLDDDPEVSQKYLGYGYEVRSQNNAKAVLATRGKVVKYNGELIKTPYFTQSDGQTKSAEEVWGWTDAPYLQSVPDTWCEETELKGHGVGMSACGARGMAQAGKDYKEIIEYFFKNVVISKVY